MTGIRPISPRVAPGQSFAPKDVTFRPRDDEVYANEFGVAGDGTDQTVNLGRALTAAASLGKTLVVPPGTYQVWNLQIPANTRLRGFGPSSIIRRVANGGGSMAARIVGSNVEISDLTIDGNGSGAGAANSGAIEIVATSGIQRVTLRNLRVTNTHNHAIRLQNTAGRLRILDCEIDNFGVSGTGDGINIASPTGGAPTTIRGIQVRGCDIIRHASNLLGYGILIRGSNDNTTRVVEHIRVKGNYIDLSNVAYPGAGLAIEVWGDHATIKGNDIEGGSFGISHARAGGTISGNTIRNAELGIEAAALAQSVGVSCTGNTIIRCRDGITAWASSEDVTIGDNTVLNFTGRGIDATADGSISDNFLRGTSAATDGIRADGPMTIEGNTIYLDPATAGSDGIELLNSAEFAVTGNRIRANRGIHHTGNSVTQNGSIVGNNLRASTTKFVVDGGTTLGEVHRWANAGEQPSRAAYASTDALLIAQGVIVA